MPKDVKTALKSKILDSARELRSDAPATFYKLDDENKLRQKSVSTKSKIESVAVKTNSATPPAGKSPVFHFDSPISSPAASTSSLAASAAALDPLSPHTPSVHVSIAPSVVAIELPSVSIETAATECDLDEMAEAINPPLFNGVPEDDAEVWLQGLHDFIDYKAVADDKKLSLFKLRLGGLARDWLMSLPDAQKNTFEHLSTAFTARFQPKEMDKFRYARELFHDKQGADETVDQFVTKLRKKAAVVELDSALQVFAFINGLKPAISAYVLEHDHDTFEEVLKHARVAEMTRKLTTGSDTAVQLSKLTDQMSSADGDGP